MRLSYYCFYISHNVFQELLEINTDWLYELCLNFITSDKATKQCYFMFECRQKMNTYIKVYVSICHTRAGTLIVAKAFDNLLFYR